jgi:hypothetical protein
MSGCRLFSGLLTLSLVALQLVTLLLLLLVTP